jgi:hypothetical protein
MSLNVLFLTSLSPETRVSESGATVSAQRISGESILFFDIKDPAQANLIREDWGMANKPLCDCIVFYSKPSNNKKIFCLVELKGSNVAHAADQIKITHAHMLSALRGTMNAKYCSHLVKSSELIWKAYILVHGSAPQDTRQIRQDLEKIFGKNNVLIRKDSDISTFLRS